MKDSKPYKMIFQINWMLWGVLLASQVFFVAMSLPILRFDKMIGQEVAPQYPYLIPLFISLSFLFAGLSFFCHRRAYKVEAARDPQKLVESFKRFQMNNMFSWALSEGITLLGILSLLFHAPVWILFCLAISGFSLHAFYFPRVGKFFEKFVQS